MSNSPLTTSNHPPKVFIPMLTDVVAFPDGVPVLTENADDKHDIHHNHDSLNTPAAPAVEHPVPAVDVDVEALSQQMWMQLEPTLQTMLRDAVLAVLAQQQASLMEQLGANLRPMLAHTLATILQPVQAPRLHRQTEGDGQQPDTPPDA